MDDLGAWLRTSCLLAQAATQVVRNLNTVFPYEATRIASTFDVAATLANFHLMLHARPLQPVELISFPATGTARFQLVNEAGEVDGASV